MKKFAFALLLLLGAISSSCLKDPDIIQNEPGTPRVRYEDLTRNSATLIGTASGNDPGASYGFSVIEILNGEEGGRAIEHVVKQLDDDRTFSWTAELSVGTTYAVRSFVSNGLSRKYSDRLTVTTPSTSKAWLSDVTLSDGYLVASILDDGGRTIEEVGFIGGDTPDKTALMRKGMVPTTLRDGNEFRISLTVFELGATSCFIAYAKDDTDDIGYSPDVLEVSVTDRDIIRFEDPVFEAFVIRNYDRNHDGRLSYGEVREIPRIEVPTDDIVSVKEISLMPELRVLSCASSTATGGKLTALPIDKNAKLTKLICDNNRLEAINISDNPLLDTLSCAGNLLREIPIGSNPALDYLDCSRNELAQISLPKNSGLRFLSVGHNHLEALDLSPCAALRHLECSANAIKRLDLSPCRSPEYIDCQENPLDTLFLYASTKPETLLVPEGCVVYYLLDGFSLSEKSIQVRLGESAPITPLFAPEDAADKTIEWRSSDPAIASVSEDGFVTGHALGHCTIEAHSWGFTASCEVEVLPILISDILLPDALTLALGETQQLEATILPEDATNKTVTWSSSDEAIASVTQDGLITALSLGNCIITASAGGKTATCAVTVNPVAVTGITLDPQICSLIIGETQQLTATVLPENATDKTVSWSSSDESVATVSDSGLVTAVYVGSCTISVSAQGRSASCTVTVKPIAVTAVSLDIPSCTLRVGQTQQLTATVLPENATYKTLSWTSSDESIASVSGEGLITAHALGNCTITASSGDKSAICTVSVNPTPVIAVSLDIPSCLLRVGETQQLTATVLPEDATDKTVTWTTSDGAVASVSDNGLVTALSLGSCTITASSGGKSAICNVTVNPTPVTEITLDIQDFSLMIGQTQQLTATVLPEDATDKTIAWTSSNTAVATVSDGGLVTAVSLGSCSITATSGDVSASCTVTVTPIPVSSVSIDIQSLTIRIGETQQLTATVLPENATDKTVTWSSSDNSVATVSNNGLVTAIALGSCTITASSGGMNATSSVTVSPITATGVIVNPTVCALMIGESQQLEATVLPADATNKTVTWASSDASIATVSDTGLVRAISVGSCTITASSGGKSATCAVTVNPIPVSSVSLDIPSCTIRLGESQQLRATVLPENATDKTVSWASSDESIATVSENGRVTAVSLGLCTITASSGGKSATCAVTVAPIPVTRISFESPSIELTEGDTYTLTPIIEPENATDKTVRWSSSDEKVLKVEEGVVTALSAGFATVMATTNDGGLWAMCSVTVKARIYPVTSVSLDATTLALNAGETRRLTATVLPTNATNKAVSWSSSAEDVATVDGSGLVTAVGNGTATITVTTADGGFSASCSVVVTTAVTGVSLNASTLALTVDQTSALTATVEPSTASNQAVSWNSSDLAVATVSDEGVVTAVSVGEATVSVTTEDGGFSAQCSVIVSPVIIHVSSISFESPSMELTEGDQTTLVPIIEPADATDKSISWSSSDPSVLTVKDGLITAVSPGLATVTATANDSGQKALCSVTVKPRVIPVTSVSLNATTLALNAGETRRLTATVLPANATDKSVSWSSSAGAVASVDGNGLVTAVGNGTAAITATTADGGHSAICSVTVTTAVTGISLNVNTLALNAGETHQLTATVLPATASNKAVAWTTSAGSVATVNESGQVTAVGNGTATISATTADGGHTANCTVTVTTSVTGVSLNTSTLALGIGGTATLIATIEPSTASNKELTWSSSNSTVASVNQSGEVVAVASGDAVITATTQDGGFTATCSVSVQIVAGLEAVDLGLPSGTKWANMNIGATKPEETGEYFAWGETAPQSNYSWSSYALSNGTETSLTKYNYDPSLGSVDYKVTLEPEDDAANVVWGDGWRMPNYEDWQELNTYCNKQIISINGISGHVFTSKVAGYTDQSIFFPCSGFLENRQKYANNTGCYWSSSLDNAPNSGFGVSINYTGSITSVTVSDKPRIRGYHIRAVKGNINPTIPVESIFLSKESISIQTGGSFTLNVSTIPSSALYKAVCWHSDNNEIASVSDGTVTGISVGQTRIVACNAEGIKGYCTVTVTPSVTGVSLNTSSITMRIGETSTLTATVQPSTAGNKAVQWSSSNNAVATVSEGGVVTAVNAGEATITVTTVEGDYTAECIVTVLPNISSITLSPSSATLSVGEALDITATILPEELAGTKLTWTSSNESVALVSQSGHVISLAVGETTISASADGQEGTCEVSVIIPVTGITLDETSFAMYPSVTKQLTATVLPANASDKTVTWSSSDESIATVSTNGLVSGVSPGTCTITAKAGDFNATCKVTIKSTDGAVSISEDSFPDSFFRAYVTSNFDLDHDGFLSETEIRAVTSIEIGYEEVHSLDGIEFFPELLTLFCHDTKLLPAIDLSSNTKLFSVDLNNNKLLTLDLSKNIDLEYLTCHGNNLTSLDLSNNDKLIRLRCSCNSISSLVLPPSIQEVYCEQNPLYDIRLSSLTNLMHLDCSSCQLSTINVTNNTKLNSLDCSNNDISLIDLSNNVNLSTLICNNNRLKTIDLSFNVSLLSVFCLSNQLTTLNLSKNSNLTALDCGNNQLASLNLEGVSKLQILQVRSNKLSTIDVSAQTDLQTFDCSYNQLSSINLEPNTALILLSCSDNKLEALKLDSNTSLRSLSCDNNLLHTLDVSNNSALVQMVCTSNPYLTEIWLRTGQTFEQGLYYDTDVATIKYKD